MQLSMFLIQPLQRSSVSSRRQPTYLTIHILVCQLFFKNFYKFILNFFILKTVVFTVRQAAQFNRLKDCW